MPFARETLSNLRDDVLADIAARLPGSNPFQRRSALNAFGLMFAGLQNEQYGYLDYQAKQGAPFTSSGENLLGWAGLRSVTPSAPVAAIGNVVFSGTPGSPVTTPAQVQRDSDGVLYQLTVGGTIGGGGTVSLPVTAIVAGAAGDSAPGTPLTLTSPQSGIASAVVVDTGGISGGADQESWDSLRTRNNMAWASPPQGGDLADYVAWTRAGVPEVTRCWSAGPTIRGPGTVSVYFMVDNAAHTNGLPIGTNGVSQFEIRDVAAAGDQLLVADALFLKRPVTALVYAVAPIGDALNIALQEVPADSNIRASITAAVKGFLLREASPGGVTLVQRNASGILTVIPGGTVLLSHLEAAIAAVPGLDHFVMTSPATDVAAATGHIAIPGSISYSNPS